MSSFFVFLLLLFVPQLVTNVTQTASFSRIDELKKSCKTLLHAHLRVPIFCKAINRANARGYCVAAERREFLMSTTAEAATTFVATAEEIASPIANSPFERTNAPSAANLSATAAVLQVCRDARDTRHPSPQYAAMHRAIDARPMHSGVIPRLSSPSIDRHGFMISRGP
jgi:hypothetical protein